MKRKNNIYYKITNIDTIIDMYKSHIRSNTKNKYKVENFEHFLLLHFIGIQRMLINKNVKFGRYNIFIIKEPKYRIIMSQTLNDKLINHLVAKYFLLDIFEPTLLDCNVATRKNKGTLYGVKLVKKYINELKLKTDTIYYLKCDITKYFYSIEHEKLLNIIKRKIKDNDAIDLISNIISTTNSTYVKEVIDKLKNEEIKKINNLNISDFNKEKLIEQLHKIPTFDVNGKGISIGSMTSQAFAIIYLNDLDHYIKEKLHIKYYVRDMDDFVLLHHDKNYLRYCYSIIKEKLEKEYLLNLNPKTKIGIIKNNNALNFLGYRFYLGKNNKIYLKIRNENKKRFKNKIKKMCKLYKKGKIDKLSINQVVASYKAHFSHANAHNFQKQFFNKNRYINCIYRDKTT